MLTFPPLYPPRPRRVRRLRQSATPPAPPAPLTVVSVTLWGPYYADWEFSAPVTLMGANVPELQINPEGEGMTGPTAVEQLGPTVLRADYTTTPGIYGGDPWQILAQPGNIQRQVRVPQEGEVA